MPKEKIKVYLYTRVSTAMQIDGYSLEAQKTKMKALVDNIQIYEERKENGQWLNSIEFKLPIIETAIIHPVIDRLLLLTDKQI